MDVIVCPTCGERKPRADYAKKAASCKVCRRAYDRRRKYGVTDELFRTMMSKQDNRCGICLDHLDDVRKPFIDHDHQTLQTRGILCSHCNSMLGFARDNPINLIRALHYLKKYGR
jgi:uncharacterized CHY-type Zn-finger protein